MKKIAFVVSTLVLALVAGSAVAATPAKPSGSTAAPTSTSTGGGSSASNSLNTGSMGLHVEAISGIVVPTTLISGKYFLQKDMAVIGGFGFQTGGPSGSTTTAYSLVAGIRKYMKTDDFAPFVGGVFEYQSASGTPSSSGLGLLGVAGVEYFMAKQFSVEGSVRFGYTSQDQAGIKSSFFGTSTTNLSVNFYF